MCSVFSNPFFLFHILLKASNPNASSTCLNKNPHIPELNLIKLYLKLYCGLKAVYSSDKLRRVHLKRTVVKPLTSKGAAMFS